MFAFACKRSFDSGYGGVVSFIAKSTLVRHYEQALYVEQRQPTEEEERLFRAFMQKRKAAQNEIKKTAQPVGKKKRPHTDVMA